MGQVTAFTAMRSNYCGQSTAAAIMGTSGPPSVSPGTTWDFLGTMRFHLSLTDCDRRPSVLLIYFLELLKGFRIGIFQKIFFH